MTETIEQNEGKEQNKNENSFASYNVIKSRLIDRSNELKNKLNKLNSERLDIFGETENKLLKSEAIVTENSCVPRDMVSISGKVILGYNVHFGLKNITKISDIFSVYEYENLSFKKCENSLIDDEKFKNDFKELFKYYKESFFAKFLEKDGFLHMIFQNGEDEKNIKSFKWFIKDDKLEYIGNRFAHEVIYPTQQEFNWIKTVREDQVSGLYPHVSIKDKLFVETIGGDLTLKIENNTNSGEGIYAEEVEIMDQSLDDGEIYYAIVDNLILLKIKPYQEKRYRYFIFNDKTKDVYRIDSMERALVFLPEGHGVIFPNGICLQSGVFKKFEINSEHLIFEGKKISPNGEDFQYIFYDMETGEYYIYSYNLISQTIESPLQCNGYSHFLNGDMVLFKADNEPKRNHTIQIWNTSFTGDGFEKKNVKSDKFLYSLGNKAVVKCIADCNSLYNLARKDDSYYGLYIDIVKDAETISNAYFWINKEEAFDLKKTLLDIKEAAVIAIKEFEKISKIKELTKKQFKEIEEKVAKLVKTIGYTTFENINDYVKYLTLIRTTRGEIAALKDLQFIELKAVDKLVLDIKEKNEKLSEDCVTFLLKDESLEPYIKQVEEIEGSINSVTKVVEGNELADKITTVSEELEMLINIVSNLKIADSTKTSEIIDKISILFAKLNQCKSKLTNIVDNLDSKERKTEFYSKLNLLTHSVSNYLELSDTVDKVENYLTKIIVQIDELESKFSDFDEFIPMLAEKREELVSAFETKKQQLMEKKSKKIDSISNAADRIFKGLENRVKSLDKVSDINETFSTDLMIEKIRDIVDKLIDLGDATKAEDIENKLKTLKENTIKQLKDKKELFLDGNTIKLGKNHFLVNNQKTELSFLRKEDGFYFHISGTDFWEKIDNSQFIDYKEVWDQEIISENKEVYRAEFLSYNIFIKYQNRNILDELYRLDDKELKLIIKKYMEENYNEYYTKGVNDLDGFKILKILISTYRELDLASYSPILRFVANLFWEYGVESDKKKILEKRLKSVNLISKYTKRTLVNRFLPSLEQDINKFLENNVWIVIEDIDAKKVAEYLAKEISQNNTFVMSLEASNLYNDFNSYLVSNNAKSDYSNSIISMKDDIEGKFILINEWMSSFVIEKNIEDSNFNFEVLSILMINDYSKRRIITKNSDIKLEGMLGLHNLIENGIYKINILDYFEKLYYFSKNNIVKYKLFQELKFEKIKEIRERLKFEELSPKVLTSFVRNKLIDQVYLPLIGDNFAKQIGVAGKNKRTDNMGMLLLVSPPGYGKTTLIEYLSNRLNMMLVKINCPTIGHNVTSLDPDQADNVNAKEEIKKLNLAFEIGNNVLIYLDDIQHSNPEFLQKFISLCDGSRKIEGIYNGKSKTYDFRGKKVAVVMAGNPYTESGDKFQIPDMLSNRADVYNLGDMIRENEEAFKLSYIENALTSNQYLNQLYMKNAEDVYRLVKCVESGDRENLELEGTYTEQETEENLGILTSLLKIRDEVLTVNMEYIYSASQNDEYRIEPPFKLQGSYRNMNKISEKVVPVMNEDEIRKLIENSYENDAQTLSNEAEASLLKFREITDRLDETKLARWKEIKDIYIKNKEGSSGDKINSVISELNYIGSSLEMMRDSMLDININTNGGHNKSNINDKNLEKQTIKNRRK